MGNGVARENIFPPGPSKPTGHWTTVTAARPGKLVHARSRAGCSRGAWPQERT